MHHNDKQRYRMLKEGGITYIGASQGHSFRVDPNQVHTFIPVGEVPDIIHGTHYDFLRSILRHGLRPGGLKEGHRQMVHCLPDRRSSWQFFPPRVDTLPGEIDLMGANWDTPLLPNDAFILRRSVQDELPAQAKGIQYAKEFLTAHLAGQGDDTGRVAETIIRRTKHMRVNAAYEYLMRSVPVELRITCIAWLARRS